jgi:NAD(P)-dependent dehydrogenase (short-subunit alcohol dehydrogenase family)
MAPYCASKWAVEGLTLSLAHELPPGMAAVTLNPGIVKTDMHV